MATLNDLINELLKQNISLDSTDQNNSNFNDDSYQNKDRDASGSGNQIINNEKTFNQLTTYLPIINVKNLESFIEDVKEKLYTIENHINKKSLSLSSSSNNNNTNNITQFYRINNSFYDTINELSLKYNSIIRKGNNNNTTSLSTTNTTTSTTETNQLSKVYSSIYYLFTIQLLKSILKMEFNDIIYLLNDYYIEDDNGVFDDDDDSDYENIEGEAERSEYIENLVVTNTIISQTVDDDEQEEVDDFVYEPFDQNPSSNNNNNNNNKNNNNNNSKNKNNNSNSNDINTSINEFYQHNQDKLATWNTISRKLEPIIKSLSYDCLSHDSVWEDFSILEDIQEISTLLFENQNLKEIYDYFPNFIYLLRDRIIHKTTDIPYILPIIFNIIKISPDDSDKLLSPFQFKTILSILDSLVCLKQLPKQSIHSICKYIVKYMNYFLDRLSFWVTLPNELFNQINSSFELESILNIINFYTENPLSDVDNGNWSLTLLNKGILSQFMNLVVTKLLVNFDETSIKAISMFCCRSEMLSHFIQKVPEFMNLVLTDQNFINRFNHYRIIWFFILSNYPQTQSDSESFQNNFIDGLKTYIEVIDIKDKLIIQQVETILSILVITKQNHPKLNIFSDDTSKLQQLLSQFEKKLIQIKQSKSTSSSTTTTTTNNNHHHEESHDEFQIFQSIRSYLKYLRVGSNK